MKQLFAILIISMISITSNSQTKCNCCTEKHTGFDFWIGNWTVTNPDGSAAGTNTIEKFRITAYYEKTGLVPLQVLQELVIIFTMPQKNNGNKFG